MVHDASSAVSSDPQPELDTAGVQWFRDTFDEMTANIERAVLGKRHVVRLVLACLLTDGHVLLEDLPGTGKTLLARGLSQTVSGTHARIQFTPDLLPSDVTGVTIYEQHKHEFEFHRGPVFHQIVLVDEINRASAKTQAALLEVMAEGHVTVDGVTHDVPQPFMVVATQNPIEQAGTYRLPEAQLDRFLMKVSMGYPDAAATEEMLLDSRVRDRGSLVQPVVSGETVLRMRGMADAVYVDRSVVSYVRRLAEASRESAQVRMGVSPRGCLALVRAAKTWAAADGRDYVAPQDVQALASPVLCHRLVLDAQAAFRGASAEALVAELLATVAPPETRR